MLSPLFAGEVDLPLLQALSKRAPVGMDIQGFVRVPVENDLIFQPWAEMVEGLKYITYLKVDKAEAEFLTGLSDLHEAAIKLHSLGPKEIVLTQTSGVTVLADGKFHTAPFTSAFPCGSDGQGRHLFLNLYCQTAERGCGNCLPVGRSCHLIKTGSSRTLEGHACRC